MRKERKKEETERHLFSVRVSREIEEGFSSRSKIDNRIDNRSVDFLVGETEDFLKFRSRAIPEITPLVRFGTDILEADIGIERDKWREISEYEPKNRSPVRGIHGLISFPYFSRGGEVSVFFIERITKSARSRKRKREAN